jgi:hypothetical protein
MKDVLTEAAALDMDVQVSAKYLLAVEARINELTAELVAARAEITRLEGLAR